MPTKLELVQTADFAGDIDTLDMLGFAEGVELADDGWAQAVADDDQARDYEPIAETINLYLSGSDHNALAVYDAAVKNFLRKAGLYGESAERYGVWLRTNMGDETHDRQALITKAMMGRTNVMSLAAGRHSFVRDYPFMLKRMPLWEPTSHTTYALGSIKVAGGTADISNVPGTDPARIAKVSMYGLTEVWFGFRSARHCTPADFTCPWELENSSAGAANVDTAAAADAFASPGGAGDTVMSCSFLTTETMASRVKLTGHDISASHYEDLRGTYEMILIAKCAAGITANVRLAIGLPNGSPDTAAYQYNNAVPVTGTAYSAYSLGRITFPAGGKVVPADDTGTTSPSYCTAVIVQAELADGVAIANALVMDCLVPVPVDEGYGHIRRVASETPSHGVIYCSPNGIITGIEPKDSSGYSGITDTAGTTPATFHMPVGTSKLIVAASGIAYSSVIQDFTIYAKPRWRTLIGDDA